MWTSMPVTRLGKHGPAASWPQRVNSDSSFAVHQWQLVYYWNLPIGNGNFAASWGSVAFASTSLWWLAWCMELMLFFLCCSWCCSRVAITCCMKDFHESFWICWVLYWLSSEQAEQEEQAQQVQQVQVRWDKESNMHSIAKCSPEWSCKLQAQNDFWKSIADTKRKTKKRQFSWLVPN